MNPSNHTYSLDKSGTSSSHQDAAWREARDSRQGEWGARINLLATMAGFVLKTRAVLKQFAYLQSKYYADTQNYR